MFLATNSDLIPASGLGKIPGAQRPEEARGQLERVILYYTERSALHPGAIFTDRRTHSTKTFVSQRILIFTLDQLTSFCVGEVGF